MNANGLINMAVRMVMHRLMSRGIEKGIDLASRRGQAPGEDGQPKADDPRLTAQSRDTAKRARQMVRLTRRVGRF